MKRLLVIIFIFVPLFTEAADNRPSLAVYFGGGRSNIGDKTFVTEYGGGLSFYYRANWWIGRSDLTYYQRDAYYFDHIIDFDICFFVKPIPGRFYPYFGPFAGVNETVDGDTWREPDMVGGFLGGFTYGNKNKSFHFSLEVGYKRVSESSLLVTNGSMGYKSWRNTYLFTIIAFEDMVESEPVPSPSYRIRGAVGVEFDF